MFMNKSVCLSLATFEICKIVMYKIWYGCVQPKYGKKQNYDKI